MQLKAQEDIEAPLDRVFEELSDFPAIERQIMRRSVSVQRLDDLDTKAAGMKWEAVFGFRGKDRSVQITLSEYQPPEKMVFDSASGGLEATSVIELVPLSRGRTRVNFVTDLKPQTLSARLLVQSLKLAKGGVDKRFGGRVAAYASELEERINRNA